ncbi:MAG: TolB family protein [Prevotella sp.]
MKRILYAILTLCLIHSCTNESVRDATQETAQPRIYPDYVDVTIPVNIAPLNFCMADEDALLIDAVISDRHGNSLHSQGEESLDFDIGDWHRLLDENRGDSLTVTVSAKYDDGWHTYSPFFLSVSNDSIDYGLCYRLIEPGYEVWSKMGIYERDLSSFSERALIENTQFEGCVNCHSFNRGNAEDMSIHVRGPHGATLLRNNGGAFTAFNTTTDATLGPCVYPYWHPSGRYIAYSTNATSQVFHGCDPNRVEVFDSASDLQVYDVRRNRLILSPPLRRDSIYETFPAFSADGRSLYFCAARAVPESSMQLDSIHYNLCRIDFDPATGGFGSRIDTIVGAEAQRKSVSFPRPSYDGRFLCYTLSDYGQFSIWHREADLCLLNLLTGESRSMTAANSAETESFHNWSANSRWLVFSSRRDDGLYTRPYFCHVAADGTVGKAFMLPQRNPRRFYRERFFSFNVPDFVVAPIRFDAYNACRTINDETRKRFETVHK